MANPREVKTRLRGVRKTQQITRAMKMVATVRLRHAQAALANSRPYAERMLSLAADLLAQIEQPPADNPFFSRRTVTRASAAAPSVAQGAMDGRQGAPAFAKSAMAGEGRMADKSPRRENILLIVAASDRGLCGSMNANIFRQVLRSIDDLIGTAQNAQKPEIHLLLIGRKAKDFFQARQNAQTGDLPYRIRETVPFGELDSAKLSSQCCELYRKGEYDRIDLFYNELFSALQHRPARVTLFPLDFARMRKPAGRPAGNVLFEPDCVAMLDDVICGYIVSRVRKIMLEAEVAEHAARMLMMDLATKNADDLISAMQLTMNKLRQLSITNELADITTGAEAVG